jgi:hypothetical protein
MKKSYSETVLQRSGLTAKRFYRLFIAGLLVLCACNPVQTVEQKSIPSEYTSAWEERYGVCYDSISYAVVALDLYTDGLTLDTAKHRMNGTGFNLYLSDIFVPADTLAPGEYKTITNNQTPITPYTFLPGKDYEGTPTGMYLLYVENGKLQGIQVLDSGSFVMRDTLNGLTDLQFTLYYSDDGDNNTYECHFQGPLPWLNK